jgi:uncharacterized protein (TIGR00730 family)
MKRLCVFCGSSAGARPDYTEAARSLGDLMGRRGVTLVYGGGNVGLMGTVADAALAAGGEVIGVIPHLLARKELAHTGLTDLRMVETMQERKALMADLSDAFLALPGAYGTLDELCEVLTWLQLKLVRKPLGLLNVHGYFDALLGFFDHAVREGFLRPQHRDMLLADDDAESLLGRLEQYQIPEIDKAAPSRGA